MRKLIIACAVAAAAALSFGSAARAESITLRFGDQPSYHYRYYDEGWHHDRGYRAAYRHHHRHWRHNRHWQQYRRCYDRRVIAYRYGERIVKDIRVCE